MIADVLAAAAERMEKSIESARDDFGTVRSGRADPRLFQRIPVDYYGTQTPLGQLASLQVAEARMVVVTPYDKSALKDIEKALVAGTQSLSANVGNDGQIVRVTLPELTQERRKEFVKLVRQKGEEARVALRNIRRKAKDDLDALTSQVGEDEVGRANKDLEAMTKKFVDLIDDALKNKESELLEV